MKTWSNVVATAILLAASGLAAPAHAVVVSGSVTLLLDGQPAVGAEVRLLRIIPFGEELVGQQTLGGAGTYAFNAAATGSFSLRVALSGHVPVQRSLSAPDNTPQVADFVLSLPSNLTVTVVDAATQSALVGSTVQIIGSDVSSQVASDILGQAVFTGISGGALTVCVIAPADAYRNECYENQFLPPNNSLAGILPYSLGSGATSSITMQLDPGSALSGTLTDRYFAQPVNGPVTLSFFDGSGTSLFTLNRTLQANGDYEVRGLAPGSYHVRASGAGNNYYTPRVHPDINCSPSCTVTNGTLFTLNGTDAAVDVDFDLHPGGVALGSVTESGTGAPIVGATVVGYLPFITFVERTRTTSGPSGQFVLAHIPPESQRLGTLGITTHINEAWPNLPCYVTQCGQGQTLTFGVDQVQGGFDFVLDAAGSIRGTITDTATGTPLAATLQVRSQSGAITYQVPVVAQPSGYSSIGLPPGTYFAAAFTNQGSCEVWSEQACAVPGPIDPLTATPIVITGATSANNVNFTLVESPLFANGFEG